LQRLESVGWITTGGRPAAERDALSGGQKIKEGERKILKGPMETGCGGGDG